MERGIRELLSLVWNKSLYPESLSQWLWSQLHQKNTYERGEVCCGKLMVSEQCSDKASKDGHLLFNIQVGQEKEEQLIYLRLLRRASVIQRIESYSTDFCPT